MASTIKNVAKIAGCSITTVSRYYSAPELLKSETKKRIEYAAKSCNYSPNLIARAMVKQRNNTIAFVVSDKNYPVSNNPFYADIFQAVQLKAQKMGYTVILTSNSHFFNDAETMMSNKSVDGVILAGNCDEAILENLHSQLASVVLVNSDSRYSDVASVTADNYQGTVDAIEHLIVKGHIKIGMVTGNLYSYISNSRQRAFFDTLAAHNLPIYPYHIQTTTATIPDAVVTVSKMLSIENPPSALFCMNDSIAVGAIKAAIRKGLKVPEQLAVIGYDDSALCSIIEPELTSISVNTKQMGERSMEMLDLLINKKQITQNKICLTTKLICRKST